MKETLEDILDLRAKIVKDIDKLSTLLTPEVLNFAKNERKFWAGAIGHIPRQIQLFAKNIPSFELLEYPLKTENEKETVSKVFETVKTDLEDIKYPKFNRIYKLNKENFKLDVTVEPVTDPTCAIFREPIGLETYTREQWLETLESQTSAFPEGSFKDQISIFDEDIISAAKNFLLGPCGAWRNKPLLAETRTFDSLEELKENILNEAREKDMVLYRVYSYEKIEIDWNVGPPKTLEEIQNRPKTTQYAWRGVFLDKE
jgi:hypothetical protein